MVKSKPVAALMSQRPAKSAIVLFRRPTGQCRRRRVRWGP